MTLAETIEAILERDFANIRKAFGEFVERFSSRDSQVYRSVWFALATEVSAALNDDTYLMSARLCGLLALPEGSTYARGGDKLRQILRSEVDPRS